MRFDYQLRVGSLRLVDEPRSQAGQHRGLLQLAHQHQLPYQA